MKKVSQLAARKALKRVRELESTITNMRNRWGASYPGGTHIETVRLSAEETHVIDTAVKLNHTLIAKYDGVLLNIYAVRNPQ